MSIHDSIPDATEEAFRYKKRAVRLRKSQVILLEKLGACCEQKRILTAENKALKEQKGNTWNLGFNAGHQKINTLYAKALRELKTSQERVKKMYIGDLSPESRLSGYAVLTKALERRRDALRERVEELEDDLRHYGGHQAMCEYTNEVAPGTRLRLCTCGWNEALKGAKDET